MNADKRSRPYKMATRVACAVADAMLGRVTYLQGLGTDVRWEKDHGIVFTAYKEWNDRLKGRRFHKQVWRVHLTVEPVGEPEEGACLFAQRP